MPCARRIRRYIARPLAKTPPVTNSHPSAPSASNGSGSEPTPSGLVNESRVSVSMKCPGRKPRPTAPKSAAAPRIHTSLRQRRAGTCPSGNSRSASPSSANISVDIASPSDTATVPPGREPGRTSNAYSAYWAAATRAETTMPSARKTQPILLPGRCQITKAPTVANAVTAMKYTPAVTTSAADRASLNADEPGSTPTLSIDSVKVKPASATHATHTAQPRLEAARAFIALPRASAATATHERAASSPARRRAARGGAPLGAPRLAGVSQIPRGCVVRRTGAGRSAG